MQVHIFIFVMALCHIVVSNAAYTSACFAVSSLDLQSDPPAYYGWDFFFSTGSLNMSFASCAGRHRTHTHLLAAHAPLADLDGAGRSALHLVRPISCQAPHELFKSHFWM